MVDWVFFLTGTALIIIMMIRAVELEKKSLELEIIYLKIKKMNTLLNLGIEPKTSAPEIKEKETTGRKWFFFVTPVFLIKRGYISNSIYKECVDDYRKSSTPLGFPIIYSLYTFNSSVRIHAAILPQLSSFKYIGVFFSVFGSISKLDKNLFTIKRFRNQVFTSLIENILLWSLFKSSKEIALAIETVVRAELK